MSPFWLVDDLAQDDETGDSNTQLPFAWYGQEVAVRTNDNHWYEGTLNESNATGVQVDEGASRTFFPWANILLVTLVPR